MSLNSLDAGSLIEIEVRDDGVGVTADRLPHVFNRFEQAHEDTSGKYGGTGLGLAIVQKLTQAMGGVIFAQSEVGKGTVITVRLPMAVASDIALPNEETEPRTELMRPALYQHVLIAEDNDVNRLLATRFLEDVGVKVSHAKDGLEAAEMASKLDPDLILMDSNMPGLDGLEATRHIRAQEARADRKRVPIIAFTANVIGEDRVRAQEAGMDGYVSKPFRSADLINVITTDWSEMNSPECHASS